jgi:hypothetical protein
VHAVRAGRLGQITDEHPEKRYATRLDAEEVARDKGPAGPIPDMEVVAARRRSEGMGKAVRGWGRRLSPCSIQCD